MGGNLKPYVMEEHHMTPVDVLANLAEQVPGRSIGERFVVSATINKDNDLELELDDGCIFAFQCRKVN